MTEFDQNITHEAPNIPVSSAIAPDLAPTAVCAVTYSGGVQTSPFGLSLGATSIDEICQKLETVRVGASLNDAEAQALAVELYREVVNNHLGMDAVRERQQPTNVHTNNAQPTASVYVDEAQDWCEHYDPSDLRAYETQHDGPCPLR